MVDDPHHSGFVEPAHLQQLEERLTDWRRDLEEAGLSGASAPEHRRESA